MNTQETTTEENDSLAFGISNMAPSTDEIRVHVSHGSDSITVVVSRDEDGTVHVDVLDNTEFAEYRSVLGQAGSTVRL